MRRPCSSRPASSCAPSELRAASVALSTSARFLSRERRPGSLADRFRGAEQNGGPARLPPGGGHTGQSLKRESDGGSVRLVPRQQQALPVAGFRRVQVTAEFLHVAQGRQRARPASASAPFPGRRTGPRCTAPWRVRSRPGGGPPGRGRRGRVRRRPPRPRPGARSRASLCRTAAVSKSPSCTWRSPRSASRKGTSSRSPRSLTTPRASSNALTASANAPRRRASTPSSSRDIVCPHGSPAARKPSRLSLASAVPRSC